MGGYQCANTSIPDDHGPRSETVTKPALVVSVYQLYCPLPRPLSYTVQVQDSQGRTSSRQLPFYVFDPTCFRCEETESPALVKTVGVSILYRYSGADPGFVERGGGAAATASAAGAKVFGGSRLKNLFGISNGGGGAPPAPPPLNPLVIFMNRID